jgi:magnesium chelatase family protein
MHVEVPAVTPRELMRRGRDGQETSATVRARVEKARGGQLSRHKAGSAASLEIGGGTGTGACIHCNAQMGIPEIEEFCRIDDATRAFLQKAMESLSRSARAAHRTLRVARTIADLVGTESVQLEHVAEAVHYQTGERPQA